MSEGIDNLSGMIGQLDHKTTEIARQIKSARNEIAQANSKITTMPSMPELCRAPRQLHRPGRKGAKSGCRILLELHP
jgi:hypothetical protein